jgi:O-antigen biosynthesis protein
MYEHLHRYYFAADFSVGRRVLDLASGEGYGAAILAERAQHVIGLELDAKTVAHSRASYNLPNLEFVHGSMLELDAYAAGAFGLITCFEAIEHVEEHEELISAVSRVLSPDGVFIVSTPDREAYNATIPERNPFHVRELDRSEFLGVLAPHFRHVALWGQTGVRGSRLVRLDARTSRDASTKELLVSEEHGAWELTSSAPAPTFSSPWRLASHPQRAACRPISSLPRSRSPVRATKR